MIVEMESHKFEVKRVRHLQNYRHKCTFVTLLSYIFLGIVLYTSLVWCHFWLQILTKKSILAFELLKSLIKQKKWYLSNKVMFLSIFLSIALIFMKKNFVIRFVAYYQFFCKVSLKFVKGIWSYCIYIKLGFFWMFATCLSFLNMSKKTNDEK